MKCLFLIIILKDLFGFSRIRMLDRRDFIMESTLRPSSSFGWTTSIDVGQLDKINAIPNKATDNILMDDLCPEDKLYLNALMDSDPSDSDDDENTPPRSTWSPMVQSPVIMNKRMKKLRPSYAVTLSLEDISYIRPSWGLSKGVKTIEINKQKKIVPESDIRKPKKEKSEKVIKHNPAYHYFLILMTILVFLLTIVTYVVDKKRVNDRIFSNKIQVNPKTRVLEIYEPASEHLEPILKVHFAQSIPRDLRPDECTCDIYSTETRRYDKSEPIERNDNCSTCLDWAVRANLRVFVDEKKVEDSYCYQIKWQSYDALLTPLVDCFLLGDGDWLGLGDIQASSWPLNKLQLDWTPLITNLSAEFLNADSMGIRNIGYNQLITGSYTNFSLFSTSGIHIGNLRTDFETSIKISHDPESGAKRLCLSVACTDKCSQTWPRSDHINRLRYHNNFLEYEICSGKSVSALVQRQMEDRIRSTLNDMIKLENADFVKINATAMIQSQSERMIERESQPRQKMTGNSSRIGLEPLATVDNSTRVQGLPEGIGLIDRTIFATSPEFMPVLDGLTLRNYVEKIVSLNFKTSPIVLIDTRWQTYVGSLKLNVASFPKAKILFEIFHNKGFKVVLTVKAYMDTSIGIADLNLLHNAGRIYTASYRRDAHLGKFEGYWRVGASLKDFLIRRQSLFTYHNQTIGIGQKDTVKVPYLTRCKESQEGYCAIIDLTQATNRDWLISSIKRSNLLTSEADGIQIGGAHPNSFNWYDHYKSGASELAKSLFYKEKLFVIPQWTGDFGYIQLAPRHCSWGGLNSVVSSVINFGMIGFSLVHPGSVWGDLQSPNQTSRADESLVRSHSRLDSVYSDNQAAEKSDEELAIRWLQVFVFLPILQFNNLAPIENYRLHEMLQSLVRVRKVHLVPEMKKHLPFTPLISNSKVPSASELSQQLPLIRPVWFGQEDEGSLIIDQFTVGPDILVAPILSEGLRQRDIYLPNGFWHDELRQTNLRGGKWLRNYPVELNEIAWFTRTKR